MIKVFEKRSHYRKEVAVYERLAEYGVEKILQFNVPQMRECSNDLLCISMTTVIAPYLLDFADCDLDEPCFPIDSIQNLIYDKTRLFDANADDAEALFHYLVRHFGIYYWDIKPQNLNFGDD